MDQSLSVSAPKRINHKWIRSLFRSGPPQGAYLIFLAAMSASFSAPVSAQERVYLSDLAAGSIGNLIPYGNFEDIDALSSGTNVTPVGGGGSIFFAFDPEADPFAYNSFSGPLEILLDGASPAGGNFIAGPLSGQVGITVVLVDFSNAIDEFGRPKDLVAGREYEAVFWVRPSLFQDANGDQWYFNLINPTVNPIFAGPSTGAEVSGWAPDEWSEYTVTFVYDPAVTHQDFILARDGQLVTQFNGQGGSQPALFQTSILVTQLDYGAILRLDTSIAHEVLPDTLLELMTLPSLNDRVGNRHWAGEEGAFAESAFVFCKDPAQNFSCAVTPEQAQVFAGVPVTDTIIEGQGVWVELDGARTQYDPQSGTTGASYDAVIAGLRIGYDHVLHETDAGDRLIGGINLRYRTSDADVTESGVESTISTTGIGLGGSLTWYAENGLYVDAQAQVMALDTDMSTAAVGKFVDGHQLLGYAVSVEAGKDIALSETLTITPQAQLNYATVQEDGYTDNQGNDISFDAESLQFRLGVEVSQETSWEAEDGTTSRRDLRVGAHVVKEFVPETSVDISGTTLRSEADDTTGEITLGGTYNWKDDKYSVYGQVGASTGLNSFGDSTRLRGTVGMRVQWE